MKQKSEQTQKFLYALPAALIALLALAMAALCAVALCYAVAIQIAWDSVMAFFILFGLSFIGAGLCAISVAGFFTYMRRVWYDRWPQSPGARLFVRADEGVKPVGGNTADEKSGDEAESDAESGQTTLKNAKNKSSSVIFKPKFLTLQNVGYGMLLIAVVFVVVSAALGSLNSDNWIEARRGYLEEHGYYADSMPIRLEFSPNEVSEINISVNDRKTVVVYDSSVSRIVLEYYELYSGEYSISTTEVEQDIDILNITRMPEPAHDDPIDKMLDLCFQPNRIEEQVVITIPAAYRDSIKVNGENIIYAKD